MGHEGSVGAGLISVNEAKRIVAENALASQPVIVGLEAAIGLTLAEDVFSKLDIPAFNQSSVDGYAFAFDDVREPLLVNGEMAAGAHENFCFRMDTQRAYSQGLRFRAMQTRW
jgi:molybdopterin molybdotransferase